MDRFGRAGFVSASLALADSGAVPFLPAREDAGVVFGSNDGCRDSLVEFALSMKGSPGALGLSPAVFAQTVHNSVNGELAIAWGLGGVSETLLSGRTGGGDAIARGAELVAAGRAALVVAGGAEGGHPRMNGWAVAEAEAAGLPRRPGRPEAGAALVLVAAPRRGAAAGAGAKAEMVGAEAFFEPDDLTARERVGEALARCFAGSPPALVVLAGIDLGHPLERPGDRVACVGVPGSGDLYGAAGAVGAVVAVREIEAGRAGSAAVVIRDPGGPVTLLAFRSPRTA
jgi:3-oxoacyl-[acyl-carrier-protein] synthase II